jgi:hypothetical protein
VRKFLELPPRDPVQSIFRNRLRRQIKQEKRERSFAVSAAQSKGHFSRQPRFIHAYPISRHRFCNALNCPTRLELSRTSLRPKAHTCLILARLILRFRHSWEKPGFVSWAPSAQGDGVHAARFCLAAARSAARPARRMRTPRQGTSYVHARERVLMQRYFLKKNTLPGQSGPPSLLI